MANESMGVPAPTANPRGVDAGRGAGWWGEAWRLFARSPGTWILIVLILFALNIVLAVIPFVGSLAGQLLFPLFAGGLMLGCRALDRGEALSFNHLFAGFGQRSGALFVAGLIYTALALAIIFVVVGLLILFFGTAILSTLWRLGDPISGAALLGEMFSAILVGALLFLLLYLPLVMAIWFTPALIALRGMEPLQAMKLSLLGCARNIVPFLLYGIIGIALALVATIPLMLGWLVLGPVTIASIYTSYCDIYEDEPATAAAV